MLQTVKMPCAKLSSRSLSHLQGSTKLVFLSPGSLSLAGATVRRPCRGGHVGITAPPDVIGQAHWCFSVTPCRALFGRSKAPEGRGRAAGGEQREPPDEDAYKCRAPVGARDGWGFRDRSGPAVTGDTWEARGL